MFDETGDAARSQAGRRWCSTPTATGNGTTVGTTSQSIET
jgi:hypothetical protein